MAKISPSSLLIDVRGKLGGLVFSSNKSGGYLTTLKRPIQPNTTAQRNIRGRTRSAALWWTENRLDTPPDPPWNTQSYKAHWDDFAALPERIRYDYWGEPYTVTGYNEFLNFAVVEALDGNAFRETPPTDPIPALWPDLEVCLRSSDRASGSYIKSTTTSTIQSSYPWLTLNVRYSLARDDSIPPYRFVWAGPVPTANTEIDIQADIEAVFGSLPLTISGDLRFLFRHDNGKFSQSQNIFLEENVPYNWTSP